MIERWIATYERRSHDESPVLDREHAARDEPAQSHDRHRHVHVEDLLDEALVRVVRRVEEHQRERRRDRDGGRCGEWSEALGIHQSSSRKSKTATERSTKTTS
jgi:hypothetical protein